MHRTLQVRGVSTTMIFIAKAMYRTCLQRVVLQQGYL